MDGHITERAHGARIMDGRQFMQHKLHIMNLSISANHALVYYLLAKLCCCQHCLHVALELQDVARLRKFSSYDVILVIDRQSNGAILDLLLCSVDSQTRTMNTFQFIWKHFQLKGQKEK